MSSQNSRPPSDHLMAQGGSSDSLSDNPVILASVGRGGTNLIDDVRCVARLLTLAGFASFPEVDMSIQFPARSIQHAIHVFQRRMRLFDDGLITPSGPTFRALVSASSQHAMYDEMAGIADPVIDERCVELWERYDNLNAEIGRIEVELKTLSNHDEVQDQEAFLMALEHERDVLLARMSRFGCI